MPKRTPENLTATRRSTRLEQKRVRRNVVELMPFDSSDSTALNWSGKVLQFDNLITHAQQSDETSGVNWQNNVKTISIDVDDATHYSLPKKGQIIKKNENTIPRRSIRKVRDCRKQISEPSTALKFKLNAGASIFFGVSQQQGWETGGRRSGQAAINTHADMEDAYYVPFMANEKVHYPSDTPYTLFVLADGHGGSNASRHFCRMVPEAVQEVLCSHPLWSFREPEDQRLFREKIREMYKKLDRDYLDSQIRKFSEWTNNGYPDPMPSDQGSTLLIVILYDGVVIICNLGDSKTAICKRVPSKTPGKVPLELAYQSTIQSPGHPSKAYHVYSNGGIFRREENEKIIKPKINPPAYPADSTPSSQLKMYSSLQKARIYRPPDFQNPFGLSNDFSLNLGDTMGDLFFKLDPPLFPCEADVDFLIMESGVDYIGVMAPDGLWDHMNVKMPEFVRKLARYLGLLKSCEDSSYITSSSSDESSDSVAERIPQKYHTASSNADTAKNMLTGEQLHDLAGALCDRTKDSLDIFEKDQGRYDD
ncbi:13483_t:CDS:2, partial [Acaulospora colombiana]